MADGGPEERRHQFLRHVLELALAGRFGAPPAAFYEEQCFAGFQLLLEPLRLLASSGAFACTRILWNQGGRAVLVARTMDWPESTEPVLTVLPRGLTHDGGKVGAEDLHDPNPEQWTSKYGSLVTIVYGLGAADGMNEQGLAAHMLYLNAADFGARNAKLPGVQAGLWAQYALDNAATVTQAHGHKANVHLALEDATGDSAIVEYIDGKPVVHHGRDYLVMTNDPRYDQQLALLKGMDFSKPSSDMPLPGNVNPRDRFQRASYYLSMVPTPKSEREGVASMIAIARNVSAPFGAPYKKLWRIQHGISHRVRPDERALLLRADDKPEPHLDRPQEARL